ILESAEKEKVCFLVVGDPMIATTHIDLRLRAIEKNIPTKIIHGSSIVTAVPGLLGLQNYKFGRTTTLAYPEKDYFPISPYHIIKENKEMGLHTLVLLDIKADRNKYMTANEGIKHLLEMEKKQDMKVFAGNSIICVVARAGSAKPIIKAGEADALLNEDFGPPLHTLVVPGNLHFMELEALVKIAGLPEEIGKKMQKL
ncbi:MAG: diphthine synthase, partial [Candidatus Asgardarchaeum californiense]